MRRSASRPCWAALAAGLVTAVWASAAAAAPGGKLCGLARGWVEGHCDGAKVSRVATPARCTRAREWLDSHCPKAGKAAEPSENPYRSSAAVAEERASRGKAKRYDETKRYDDAKRYDETKHASRQSRKHAHKARTRVVYVERPGPCCYSRPVIYYQAPRYRDTVFNSDFVPRPGWEWAFYKAQEANRH
jgi:hypothetical protein